MNDLGQNCLMLHQQIFRITSNQIDFRPRLHGNGSMWNRTRNVRIGLAFTRELMEPFHTEPYPYIRGTVPYRTVPKSRVNAALFTRCFDPLKDLLSISLAMLQDKMCRRW